MVKYGTHTTPVPRRRRRLQSFNLLLSSIVPVF